MKNIYDLVFVVLVYKNIEDLKGFVDSVKKYINTSYKIVVVNSYYNEETKIKVEKFSIENDCDFINIPNKGYGYGNNRGIEFIKNSYDYRFIIISNPDIEIKKFNVNDIRNMENFIIAPSIVNNKLNEQNPHIILESEMMDLMKFNGFVKEKKYLILIPIIINKILRILFNFYTKINRKNKYRIYECHGSFLILGRQAIEKMQTLYNEEMFLFVEEDHLAKLAKKNDVETYFVPNISVFHKEDGSVGDINDRVYSITKKSYITYFNYWYTK